ncbi:MAG: Response regulator of zinc sigma-54-dependent two-component system [Cyanobacteria bacterium RYN_339]|nr:Response regulator of zinc sigma-54-dependent two-component system [Cyanobacteria bacterium RYN_339]
MSFRVLVVDDDILNLDLINLRLQAHGFESECVETGQEGLERGLSGGFDAVLLDLRLPDLDGTEVLAGLRRKLPHLPVIVMTAHGSPIVRSQVLALGATTYMLKPVRRQELIDALEAALGKRAP